MPKPIDSYKVRMECKGVPHTKEDIDRARKMFKSIERRILWLRIKKQGMSFLETAFWYCVFSTAFHLLSIPGIWVLKLVGIPIPILYSSVEWRWCLLAVFAIDGALRVYADRKQSKPDNQDQLHAE